MQGRAPPCSSLVFTARMGVGWGATPRGCKVLHAIPAWQEALPGPP